MFSYPRQQVDGTHFWCFSQLRIWRVSQWMLEKWKKKSKVV